MRCNRYTIPSLGNLEEGNITPIYQNYLEEEGFEGHAMILKYAPSWRKELPYVKRESGSWTYIWSYKRYLVQFIDGRQKGNKCHRYISYFVEISNTYPSRVNLTFEDEILPDEG